MDIPIADVIAALSNSGFRPAEWGAGFIVMEDIAHPDVLPLILDISRETMSDSELRTHLSAMGINPQPIFVALESL